MMDDPKLKKALKHLEVQFFNHQRALQRSELSELDREAIAESVIQRFEISYDTLWKSLRRHLIDVLGLPEVPGSPKPILKLAGQQGLLPSPVEQWLKYAEARIGTTHDCSGEKAVEALSLAGAFIADAIDLYHTLTGNSWQ
ncbi:MAG: nucleotidyltransferase substrate binding protein [Magnetococcales bacterium]|nr:nucleotidyltransferase substrate binding protein [Magnetococcales bacterium]